MQRRTLLQMLGLATATYAVGGAVLSEPEKVLDAIKMPEKLYEPEVYLNGVALKEGVDWKLSPKGQLVWLAPSLLPKPGDHIHVAGYLPPVRDGVFAFRHTSSIWVMQPL